MEYLKERTCHVIILGTEHTNSALDWGKFFLSFLLFNQFVEIKRT